MNFTAIAKRIEKLIIDNSPAILTVIGVTGTITTAYLTGTATFKAANIIANEQARVNRQSNMNSLDPKHYPLELKEKFQLVWKVYIPATGTCVLTIVCIIFADRISTRRAAAVAAAYSLSEKAFSEYKEKVIEKIGENKERKVRDELAQDRIDRNPVSQREVIITGDGEVLCCDAFSGRYFKSSMEELKRSQNDINFMIINDTYATLTDFYNSIGIPSTGYSDEVGWNTNKLLNLNFSAVLSEDERPCIYIEFDTYPIRDYNQQCKP